MNEDYPEHIKLASVRSERAACQRVLDVAFGRHGWQLFVQPDPIPDPDLRGNYYTPNPYGVHPTDRQKATWISEALGINLEALDAEKEAMLAELRSVANPAHTPAGGEQG